MPLSTVVADLRADLRGNLKRQIASWQWHLKAGDNVLTAVLKRNSDAPDLALTTLSVGYEDDLVADADGTDHCACLVLAKVEGDTLPENLLETIKGSPDIIFANEGAIAAYKPSMAKISATSDIAQNDTTLRISG